MATRIEIPGPTGQHCQHSEVNTSLCLFLGRVIWNVAKGASKDISLGGRRLGECRGNVRGTFRGTFRGNFQGEEHLDTGADQYDAQDAA
jgi:hypothetical protein